MKHSLSLILLLLFSVAASAQSRPLTAEEYDKAILLAWSADRGFPFTRTQTHTVFRNGKVSFTLTERDEKEAEDRQRITWTTVEDGKTERQSRLTVRGKVYCGTNGIAWKPVPPEGCPGHMLLDRTRHPESVDYSVKTKSLGGKTVKVYRKYSVFAPLTPEGKKTFREEVSTIDERGASLSVVETAGDTRSEDRDGNHKMDLGHKNQDQADRRSEVK